MHSTKAWSKPTATVRLTYRKKINTTKWLVMTLNRLHRAMIAVDEAGSNPLCGTNRLFRVQPLERKIDGTCCLQ